MTARHLVAAVGLLSVAASCAGSPDVEGSPPVPTSAAEEMVAQGSPEASASEERTALDALRRARADWRGLGLATYRFTFRRGCLCPPEATGPFDVTVTDGVVTHVDGEPVDAGQDLVPTVDQLHDLIARALEGGGVTTGGYDGDGLPINLYLDPTPPGDGATTVDDEATYTASLLTDPQ
jgi:hypothetical protein